jgi:hypothetical protein
MGKNHRSRTGSRNAHVHAQSTHKKGDVFGHRTQLIDLTGSRWLLAEVPQGLNKLLS